MSFDAVGADDDQQVQQNYDGDGAHRRVGRFAGQRRGGTYRRPVQVDRGSSHQSFSGDNREVYIEQATYNRGFRAQRRGGFHSSEHSRDLTDDAEQLRGISQQSRPRGLPRRGRGRPQPAYFHGSMESLDDAASTESGYAKNCRVVDVSNEVYYEKCQVLIFQIHDLKQFGCRVHVNTRDHKVIITGGSAEEAMNKTEELVYQMLIEMQTIKCVDMSPGLVAALSQRKAMKWIRELFNEHKKPAVFYTDNQSVFVIAADKTIAQEAVDLLSAQIGTVDVPFGESQATFLQSQIWQSFVASIQTNWIMAVEVLASPRNVIQLVGVLSQLADADSMVRSQLAEKSVSVAELVMSSGELRYLDAYRKDFR